MTIGFPHSVSDLSLTKTLLNLHLPIPSIERIRHLKNLKLQADKPIGLPSQRRPPYLTRKSNLKSQFHN